MESLAALQFGFAPALATALLHSLWQDALIGVAAAVALMLLSRSSAAFRHAVAMAFLLAMVLLPASTFLRFWHQPASALNAGLLPAVTAPQIEAVTGGFVQQSSPVAPWLASLWFAGVGVMLVRRFGGWRMVSALEHRPFEALPADWQRRVDALRHVLRIGRDVAVRLSHEVASPFTARLLRPVIWLPISLLTQLPREQVEALLAHELAHIARMDWLWNGLQCVVEALLFFHPAAWWLGRRIRLEREHACDDLAVAACGDAIALAEALAQLECRRMPAPQLVLAAQGGSLMQRITRLLSTPPTRGRWGTRIGLVVLIATGSLLVAQVSGHGRPSLHIRASTDGVLRPGDHREITASGFDKERYYRADVDARGRLVEVYREDGVARPLDAGVRRWVSEVVRLSVPPLPPVPPAPPAPPPRGVDGVAVGAGVMPVPPVPPAPPAPPPISETAAFKSLLGVIAADAGVQARIGLPVVMAERDVHGRIDIGGGTAPDGDADLRFDLSGPKGRATAHVVAELDDGTWTIEQIDLAGPR